MFQSWWKPSNIFEAVLIQLLLLLVYGHVLCSKTSSSAAMAYAPHQHHHHHPPPPRSNMDGEGGPPWNPVQPGRGVVRWSSSSGAGGEVMAGERDDDGGPCSNKKCGVGRECRVSGAGLPECSCITDCKSGGGGGKSNKPVCGTDGRLYPTYCDLRRTACLTGAHILFSHYYQQHQGGEYHHNQEEQEQQRRLLTSDFTVHTGNGSSNHKSNNIISSRTGGGGGGNQDGGSGCFPLIQPHHHQHHHPHHHYHHHHYYHHDPDKNPLRDKNQGFEPPPSSPSPTVPSSPAPPPPPTHKDGTHFGYGDNHDDEEEEENDDLDDDDDDDDPVELQISNHHYSHSTVVSSPTPAATATYAKRTKARRNQPHPDYRGGGGGDGNQDNDDDDDISEEDSHKGGYGANPSPPPRRRGFLRKRQHHHHHPHYHQHHHYHPGLADYPNPALDGSQKEGEKISSRTTNGLMMVDDSRHGRGYGHSPAPRSYYSTFSDPRGDSERRDKDMEGTATAKEEEFSWRNLPQNEMPEQEEESSSFHHHHQLSQSRKLLEETLSPSAVTNLAWKSLHPEISRRNGSRVGGSSSSLAGGGGNGHWDDPDRKGSSFVSFSSRPSDDYPRRSSSSIQGGLESPTISPSATTSTASPRHNVCSPQDYEMLKGELFGYDISKLMKHFKLMTSVANEVALDHDDDHDGRRDDAPPAGVGGRFPRELVGMERNGDAPRSDGVMPTTASSSPPPPSWLNMEGDGPEADKDNLLRHIFTLLDRNHDSVLEYIELYKAELENRLELASPETGCQFRDFLLFDDTDHDGQLHVNEFFSSFSHFYDITMISLDKALETKYSRVVEGDGLVLRCDITGSPPPYIQWSRYGSDLSQMAIPGMKSYIDGTLSLTNVGLTYAGHYSCQSPRNPEVVQTHILDVETVPAVVLSPKASWKRAGEDLLLICRIVLPILDYSVEEQEKKEEEGQHHHHPPGFGAPTGGMGTTTVNWIWLFNGIPLRDLPSSDNSNKYIFENSSSRTGHTSRLIIRQIYFQNMGSYTCQAENGAGTGADTGSLVVIDPSSKAELQALHNTNAKQVLVFHRNGLASYSAEHCGWLWEIFGDDILQYSKESGELARAVCDQFSTSCDWGEAVQVSPNYVYAAQPSLGRLLLIDVGAVQSVGNAVGALRTCSHPSRLQYVPYTDQLWIRCEDEDEESGQTVFNVVEGASKGALEGSKATAPFPLRQRDDDDDGESEDAKGLARIRDIYLPSHHREGIKRGRKDCQFAYVSLSEETESLRRIDLRTFTYHKTNSVLNLTKFSCVPHQLHFSVSCTFSIINCLDPLSRSPNGQLIVDTLSNSVRFKTAEISGTSIASDDARILLTEKHVGNSTHVFVQRVGAYEIHLLSHFLLSNNLTTVRVVHSTLSGAYSSVAKLSSGKQVLLSLQTGKIDLVDDDNDQSELVPKDDRTLSGLYPLDNTFPLQTEKSVIVMDGEGLRPRCKFYEEIPELHSFLTLQS